MYNKFSLFPGIESEIHKLIFFKNQGLKYEISWINIIKNNALGKRRKASPVPHGYTLIFADVFTSFVH